MAACSSRSRSRTTSRSRRRASTSTGSTGRRVWREGGIHRVFDGRELRIEAAAGGVDVTPGDEAMVAQVQHFLGLPFDLDGFYSLGGGRADTRPARDRARRLSAAAAGRTRSRRSSPRSRRSRCRSSRRPRSGAASSSATASPTSTRTPSRSASGSRVRPRTSCRASASRPARRSTSSGLPAAISTWTSSRRCRTRR